MDKKVMIVVEGSLYGRLLAREFRSKGYGVCAVLDKGEDAVRYARLEKPAMILLDFMLRGDMDGIETAKIIQGELHASVFFLKGYDESNWLDRVEEVGNAAVVDGLNAPPGMIVDVVQALREVEHFT